ncbi:LLM class flavin-dependent oxidoreductase [Acidovorax sp. NPDC077693]|uniref:LLM class flavin-dependent oxidoreductase n=1 Tax=unclassified Acidovorax TaxID=2684926 RepID=UPI0037C8EE91
MIPLSILELGRVRQGSDRRTALDNARTLAQHAERLGFRRIWVAEHHNSPAVSTAATSVVLSHIAAGTTTIRVGAGGVMLPNHAPYVVAEHFGTLETLYPGRIDLGLGRAPGTDQMTLRALRRDPSNAENFPQDVLELQAFLAPKGETQQIEAVPGSGTNVPLWILGSSLFGAQLAAALGLPYAFGSQFSPQALYQALEVYRTNFQPSEQLQKPFAMIGVNVVAAETDAEARVLATSQQMTFADMFRGMPSLLKPPVADIEAYWTPREKAQTEQMLSCSVVGSAETVRNGLNQLVADTKADELLIVSDIFDLSKRMRSLEITIQAAT